MSLLSKKKGIENALHFYISKLKSYKTNKRILNIMDRSQIISFSVEYNIKPCKRNVKEYFLYNLI